MRVVRFNTLESLLPYADAWDRLAAGAPFRSWTWLSQWWRAYGPPEGSAASRARLAVLGVFDDGDALVGVAPWHIESSALHGRVLRFLGSGEVCSDYLSLLVQPEMTSAVVDILADYLVENAQANEPDALRWDLLELSGADANDLVLVELAARLAESGCKVHCRPGVNCWRLDLPTDWESYLASLGKNLRRDLRRLQRDLCDTRRAVLHVVEKIEELSKAMDILVDLHQQRHEKLGEPGCFASPRFLSFYRAVVPELLRRGEVQFHWLEIDGRPMAAEFQLVGGGVLYAYQAGVNPEALELQPGKLIDMMLIRRAIEQGYRQFDFLRGDETYKARFGARPQSMAEWRIVPRRPIARLRHNVWLAGAAMKAWAKGAIS